MADAVAPTVWGPEEDEGGVLLTRAGWVELVVFVLLEELEVWEEVETTGGLRWDNRELSKDCPERYGAEWRKKKSRS